VEAKKIFFSVRVNKADFHLEQRRKDFVGVLCSVWLADMVEELLKSLGKEDFIKSYREDEKVLMVRGGSNKVGRYLEVAVYADGGRKGIIWLPDSRGG
jgi:hypothetical protein